VQIDIDGEIYDLDLDRSIELMRSLYAQMSSETGVVGNDGKTYKLNRGVMRTALKTIMTPFVIPMIERMYSDHNILLDKPERHTDLIDYAINAMLDFMLIAGENTRAVFTSEIREDSRHTIKSIHARWETRTRTTIAEATQGTKD
jgi:hypothetical protein